jgi:hypothetical protein
MRAPRVSIPFPIRDGSLYLYFFMLYCAFIGIIGAGVNLYDQSQFLLKYLE